MPRAYPLLLSMYSTASHVPHFGFPIRLNSRTVPARLGLMLCKSKSPPDKPWDCYRGSVEFELSRRSSGIWITTLFLTLYDWPAKALGDATVSIKDVTPDISLPGELPVIEEQTVKLFEKSTYSVVNVFDVTLQPQVNFTGSVDVPEGNGTGIVWDKDGHIVTNFHVIASALSKNLGPGKVVARTSLLVQDGFQKTFQATLVGADKTKDLAVLKVDAPAEILHPITLGQSSGLKVGQRCLAIGNPFGFDHTLTVGVISGLNRDIFSQTGVVIGGGIQTDASINPGNSGGPLLNSKGELIGINTAIFTRTGTSSGVGFAIPVEATKKIVPQLIKFGKVVHAGLNAQFAPDVVAKQLNIKSGALVLSLPAKSEVAKAGLMATRRGLTGNIVLGDIVIAVNGTPVKNPSELSKILDEYQVGDDVVLKIQRDGKIVDLGVVLEETAK